MDEGNVVEMKLGMTTQKGMEMENETEAEMQPGVERELRTVRQTGVERELRTARRPGVERELRQTEVERELRTTILWIQQPIKTR